MNKGSSSINIMSSPMNSESLSMNIKSSLINIKSSFKTLIYIYRHCKSSFMYIYWSFYVMSAPDPCVPAEPRLIALTWSLRDEKQIYENKFVRICILDIKKEYLYKSKTQTKCFKVDCLRVIFYFTYAFSIIIVKYQNLHNKNPNNFAYLIFCISLKNHVNALQHRSNRNLGSGTKIHTEYKGLASFWRNTHFFMNRSGETNVFLTLHRFQTNWDISIISFWAG